ncbi:MAG: hypothetical protein AB7G06_06090 [Bdellovibrionales bacterium]
MSDGFLAYKLTAAHKAQIADALEQIGVAPLPGTEQVRDHITIAYGFSRELSHMVSEEVVITGVLIDGAGLMTLTATVDGNAKRRYDGAFYHVTDYVNRGTELPAAYGEPAGTKFEPKHSGRLLQLHHESGYGRYIPFAKPLELGYLDSVFYPPTVDGIRPPPVRGGQPVLD